MASISAALIGPRRSTTGGVSTTDTTVDAAPGRGPSSSTTVTSGKSSATPAARVGVSPPTDRRGQRPGDRVIGTAHPERLVVAGRQGSRDVAGRDDGERSRPVAGGERLADRTEVDELAGLVDIGDQHRHLHIDRSLLEREHRLDGGAVIGGGGQSVDRVGRHHDHSPTSHLAGGGGQIVGFHVCYSGFLRAMTARERPERSGCTVAGMPACSAHPATVSV
jgi:hypothetical protein